jgi:hypothetical protein
MPNHTPEIRGGVIINVPELNTIETWADYYGLDVDDDGMITVFKCVHGKNGTSDNGGIYKVGAFTKCDDWRLNKECGGGLHFCARPLQTRAYSAGDQFLACKVDMRDAQVISADKIKAPLCFVEREVTIDGDPVS